MITRNSQIVLGLIIQLPINHRQDGNNEDERTDTTGKDGDTNGHPERRTRDNHGDDAYCCCCRCKEDGHHTSATCVEGSILCRPSLLHALIGMFENKDFVITNEQIDELIGLQEKIVKNAAMYVKRNGILLYSTCTINPDENHKQVETFLKNNSDFKLISKRQFVQGIDKCDGFFYAIMKRV